jgi:N-acetyl-gamma-glutamyl-phosphate reductase
LVILGYRVGVDGREFGAGMSSNTVDLRALNYYAYTVNKIPVGILGASGYAGRELAQLIVRHPALHLAFATANEQRGTSVRIAGRDVAFVATEDAPLDQAELVFSALPHGASSEWVARARHTGARVVDLSADLRPGSGCDGITYGLTELARSAVSTSELVANPGCYATSILLALAPLAHAGLLAPGATVVANAASGVTGAGNAPKRELLFGELTEDYRAYAIGNSHRHLKEMNATLGAWGADVDVVFTPHLLPVARGILATIVAPVTALPDDPLEPWRALYGNEPFIELRGTPPTLRDVSHRNVASISAAPVVGTRAPALLVTCAIDNLLKGAAGQALQNANLMLDLDETAGLPQ